MTIKQFDTIVNNRLSTIKESLQVKAKEYRRNDNPLHNFETAARISGETPARALDGMLMKHMVSYRDILQDIDDGKLIDKKHFDEKFKDIINYFILQEAVITNYYLK